MTTDRKDRLKEFVRIKHQEIAEDKDGNYVFLSPSAWMLKMAKDNYPEITFHHTSEFKVA